MAERRSASEPRFAKRRMALVGLAFILLVLLGKLVFFPWLTRYLASPDPTEATRHAVSFFWGLGGFFGLLALWPAALAWRVFRQGKEAARTGIFLALCAAALLACAILTLGIPERFAPPVRNTGAAAR